MARPTGSCPPGRKPLLSDRETALGRRSFRPSPCRGRHLSSPRRRGGSNIHSYFWPMWLKYSFPLVAQILVPTWLKYSLTFTTAIILLSNRQSCFEKVRVFKAFQPFEYYSHSILAGGLVVTSSTTRFTCGTSLTILAEIVRTTSYGMRAQSAVMKSSVVTARMATV